MTVAIAFDTVSWVPMHSTLVSASFVALALLRRVTAISETLTVVNAELAPDGFKRSSVSNVSI